MSFVEWGVAQPLRRSSNATNLYRPSLIDAASSAAEKLDNFLSLA